MDNFKNLIKGFFMGIANIIPGVSGGTIAITLGIYDKFIHVFSHFFSDLKNNLKFIIFIILGIGIAILSMSNIIDYSYGNYPLATTLFFQGLIVGGIPLINKKIINKKVSAINISTFILAFISVIFIASAPNIFEFQFVSLDKINLLSLILVFGVGIITSATMVIPGISGSLVLLLLGYYYPIIALIKNIFKPHSILILGIFGLGVLGGIVLISRLIEYLLKNHEKNTYYGILGFIISSVISLFIINYGVIEFSVCQLIVGLILFTLGCFISYKLGEK